MKLYSRNVFDGHEFKVEGPEKWAATREEAEALKDKAWNSFNKAKETYKTKSSSPHKNRKTWKESVKLTPIGKFNPYEVAHKPNVYTKEQIDMLNELLHPIIKIELIQPKQKSLWHRIKTFFKGE